MKKSLLFFIAILFTHHLFAQPAISSFAPTSGPIGTTVTITGTNFSTTLANNIVFFGAVKATVSAATATSLTVTVPIGSTYDRITITTVNNNLTAYSLQPFHVTFPGAGPVFTATSFDPYVDFNTDGPRPVDIVNVDFDNDGKPDIATTNTTVNTISILKNTSTSGTLSYLSHAEISTGLLPNGISSGDIEGDGKPDIVISNGGADLMSVYKNTSSTGIISFASPVSFPTGLSPLGTAIGDIDGDGKPDIVVAENNSFGISIFRNTSVGGVISFAPRVSFTTVNNPFMVSIRDLDGDGKADLSIVVFGGNKLVIYRNISNPGSIAFDPRLEFAVQNIPFGIAIGDLDGDGKPDIAVNNNNSTTISIFRNISTPTNILFDPKQDIIVGVFSQLIAFGDLDGDGKLDMAATRAASASQSVAVFKNTSTSGTISFQPKIEYPVNNAPQGIVIGDFDGDGLPDIAAASSGNYKVSILRSTVVCTVAAINTQPSDSTICVGANAAFSITAGNATSYQWQVDNGSGWVDIINNAVYSGATTNTLSITGATVSMNNYRYRCVVSNSCSSLTSSSGLLTVNMPSAPVLNITASSATICQGTLVTFTAVPVNGGPGPVFQWKKNNINVGINSNTYTDNGLVNGDIITCVLTSNSLCASPNTANSNSIVMTVNSPVTPAITISTSANNVCQGTLVTFTTAITNGGLSPSFQWKKNGINVGTNSSSYSDNALNNGDIISCVLGSSLACVSPTSVSSNQVVMIIIPAVTPGVTISASANNICPGTLVTFNAIPVNGGPAPLFQWKKNGVNVGTNSPVYTDNTIANGDIISCVLISNLTATCLSTSTVSSNTITMTLQNLPGTVDLGQDKSGCTGTPVTLSAQPGFSSFLWQDGSVNSTFIATSPGSYDLKATDACGNISTDTILVSFNSKPSGFLPPDTSVCSYEPVLIKPVTSFNQYLWSNNAVGPSITINSPGLYWLQVTDNNNCIGRDSIMLYPKNCMKGFYMPNAFTPNGDTKNDFCKPLIFGNVKQYDFKIYNRYGERVFQSKELGKGWDGKIKGKPQNGDVFVWVCIYQLEGESVNTEKGAVILIR